MDEHQRAAEIVANLLDRSGIDLGEEERRTARRAAGLRVQPALLRLHQNVDLLLQRDVEPERPSR